MENRQITEIETVVPRFDNTDDKNGPEEPARGTANLLRTRSLVRVAD
jgi:hypothetical protein